MQADSPCDSMLRLLLKHPEAQSSMLGKRLWMKLCEDCCFSALFILIISSKFQVMINSCTVGNKKINISPSNALKALLKLYHTLYQSLLGEVLFSPLFEKAMWGCSLDVQTLLHTGLQTSFYKLLAFVWNWAFWGIGEIYVICLQHDALIEDPLLAHLVAKRLLTIEHLKVNNPDRPDVHFGSDLGIGHKTLRWQIPISTYSLRS